MQVHSFAYDLEAKSWSVPSFPAGDSPRTLVLAFGAPEALTQPQAMAELARAYPRSVVVGCSSAGEIHGTTIRDKSLSVTVTKLDRTDIVMTSIDVASPGDSFATGQALAKKLSVKSGLRAVMILSEGLNVNGSELVRGVNSVLEESIVVTGGLSGDGTRFKQTWVAVGGALKSNVVAAVGFYGDYVQIGHGSKGGWDKFGPERVVTKSEGNVLFELDGKPALELYKEYLGEKAKDLPSSGLLFPLALRSSNKDDKLLVRTLLAVDHEKNSLTFAGDIPKGYLAQLMKADFDRLIGGASLASAMAKENGTPLGKDSLVVAISCVGRRLVLGDRTEEEIEAVLEELPREQKAHITGFYSYGEISPYASGHCDLHNQTMTLTVFTESPTPLPRHAAAAAKRTVDQEDEKTARDLSAEARRAAMSHDAELDWGSAPKVTTPAGFRVDSFAFNLAANAWSVSAFPDTDSERTLVLAFGAPEVLGAPDCIARLAKAYPRSLVLGCSSAGEIHGTQVKDNSVSVTVARFAKTNLQLARADVAGPADSFTTGQTIARKLAAKPGLRGVMILSEGLNVNGSELVRGVNSVLDESIVVTGGLSGDGTRFKQTWVAIGGALKSNVVAAVGFYGDYVQIGHGSKGGWDKFGPERVVTKSEGNVLFELDGKPALQLYKEYLGEKAKDLPSSGLLFPLALRSSNKDDKILVRTLLAVDHEKNSLTFAGDIPKGYLAQLMKADFDRLIGGASLASAMAKENGTPLGKDSLVVAISCVGRRLVLGDRTEEEIEAVLEELPREQKAHITGFYSYGEISPYASGHCDLHNQTMTLTVFTESPTPLPRHAGAAAPSSAAAAVRPGAAASVRPPVAPPPAPARPSPMATGQHHAVRSASPGDIDAELTTANTDTRQLPMNEGFAVNALSYDLKSKAWSGAFPELDSERTLVLAFGSPDVVGAPDCMSQLARAYPKSIVVGCSSAGEIHGTQVRDESLAVTIARFERTGLQLAAMDVASSGDSFSTGQMLAKKLGNRPSLRGVMILSEGLNVNGSELVRGINSVLDESIVVTGGLSGDGTRFKQTWVAVGSKVKGNVVAAVGFYGDYVQIGHGSKGGWDKFGPERVVTKSVGNVLYELDGKPALQLYKEYLGDKAKDLPSSGLLFPLSLRSSSKDDKLLVRTLLAVDHEKNSLTFAGDIPRGYLAQLMKADFDRLIGGASLASAMAAENGSPMSRDALVVAISCVGRRLVLGDRTEEEVEAVLEALPQQSRAQITGFYSYGEISPYASGHCDLHNQTMTLTVFTESKTPLPRKIVKSKAPPLPAMVPAAPASGPMHTGVSATTPSMLVPSPAPAPTRTPIASPPPVASASAPPPPVAPGQARVPGGPVTRVPIQASGTTGATVQKQRRGDVTLVTVSGRLTESFKGESVGRDLRGTVAIDLGGVERITSFGVREWLAMLAAMQEVRRFYLLRCSEAVVNQLGMIRKFAGTAQIVSFFAPYLCTNCGDPFERGFDCEREAEAIRNGRADAVTCPHCTADGKFDDDARSYFAFAAAHLNTPVPPEIRALQDELDAQAPPAPRDAVDKTVEGNVTRVRVQTRLGNNVRWKRVLDGIEGALVIDLGGVTGIEPAGLTNFEQALNGLGAEVTSIAIDRCPAQLVERFAQVGTPRRVSVTSANLDAYCRSCAVHRTAHVSIQEHGDALAQNTPPRVNCKRCNGEVELRGADLALNYLRSQMQGDISRRPSLEVPMSLGGLALGKTPDSRRTDDVAAGAAPATSALKGRPIGMPIAIGALSLTVVVLVVMQMSRATAPTAAAHPNATTGTPTTAEPATKDTTAATTAPAQPVGWMQNVDLPPSWVERPFVLDGDNAFVVGKGELSPTPEAAIAQARNDAIVRLMKQVQQELAGTPTAEFLQARMRDPDKNTSEAIAERYMKQFGTTAAPERVDAALRKRDSSVEGFARYKLSKAAYQGIVNAYRETMTLQGMTIARFFPLLETTLHADGDLIVLSVQRGRPAAEQGVRAGDVLVSVAGRPVGSIDSLVKVSNEVWGNTTPRSTMSVDIESAGAKHTIRFFKPVPPNP